MDEGQRELEREDASDTHYSEKLSMRKGKPRGVSEAEEYPDGKRENERDEK